MKKCKKCGEIKPYSEFKKDKRNKNGAGSPCLQCYKVYLDSDHQKKGSYLRVKRWYEINKDSLKGSEKRLEAYRKYHKKNKEKTKAYNKQYFQKNKTKIYELFKKYPEKQRARWKLKEQIRSGKIIRPSLCDLCGMDGKIEAHHHDYSKPLDVIWLCVPCHKKQHYKYKGKQYDITSSNN